MVCKNVRRKRNRVQRLLEAQNNRCFYCDMEFDHTKAKQPTQEHLIRVCEGGTFGNNNIVLACKPCNHGRADHPPEYWKHDGYRLQVRQIRNEHERLRREWKRKHIYFPILDVVKHQGTARWLSNKVHRVIAIRCHIRHAFMVQYLRFKYRNEVEVI